MIMRTAKLEIKDRVELFVTLMNEPERLSDESFWAALPMLLHFSRHQLLNISKRLHALAKQVDDCRIVLWGEVCSRLASPCDHSVREAIVMCVPPARSSN
jgi:hypothetical protein